MPRQVHAGSPPSPHGPSLARPVGAVPPRPSPWLRADAAPTPAERQRPLVPGGRHRQQAGTTKICDGLGDGVLVNLGAQGFSNS